MDSSSKRFDENGTDDYIKNLEERLSRLENLLKVHSGKAEEPKLEEIDRIKTDYEREEELEFRIGQNWFAKVGITVLILGIAFLLTSPFENVPAGIPSIIGYTIVASLFGFAYYWRETFQHITDYLTGGGILILFITTMRLHFFSIRPAVQDFTLELILLIIAVGIGFIISVKRRSIYLAGLSFFLGYATPVIANNAYYFFITLTILSIISVHFKLKYEWSNLLSLCIFLTYLAHFNWFINNPIIKQPIQTLAEPKINLAFILLYALIFSLGNILRDKSTSENFSVISTTVMNSIGCYGLFFIITMIETPSYLGFYHLAAAVLFLTLAVVVWVREKSKYSTFVFAIFGYIAFSVAIISNFDKPYFFPWLCWQSLLVISTAIWFRSKIIILANYIIFIIIFTTFLFIAGDNGLMSLSFGIVALLSARILNWKKDRLELKTEMMRNSYLLTAFFIIPYSLYLIMPSELVAFGWIAIAISYYIFSVILKNKKYRWMSLATYLLTALYVFVLGITSSVTVYKILSFLVVGGALIILSIIYARDKNKSSSQRKANG